MGINKCAICAEMMPTHTAYMVHMEVLHKPGVVKPKEGRFLTKTEKAAIVTRGEERLGLNNFFGGIL